MCHPYLMVVGVDTSARYQTSSCCASAVDRKSKVGQTCSRTLEVVTAVCNRTDVLFDHLTIATKNNLWPYIVCSPKKHAF